VLMLLLRLMLNFDMIIHRHRWALGGAITFLHIP